MNCSTIHKNLIFFLEEELPANEKELVKIHLSDCEECALFAEDLKRTLEILEADKLPGVNPFFYTRLTAKLDRINNKKESFWKPVLVKAQPAFFSLLLLAGIYTGFAIGKTSSLQVAVSTMQSQENIPLLNEMENETIENFLME
jgi:hypothetical protein